jgi:hypothetical protein
MTDPPQTVESKGRIVAPLLVGGLWVAISAVIEFICAWNLPHVGEAWFYDGGNGVGSEGILVLVALGLGASGTAVSCWLVTSRRRFKARWGAALATIVVGSIVVLSLAAIWMEGDALPLHVKAWHGRLVRLANCVEHRATACPTSTEWLVPGLGEVGPSGRYAAADPYARRGEVQLLRDVGSPADEIEAGYLYAPGATTVASLGFPGAGDSYVHHLYGAWWEIQTDEGTDALQDNPGYPLILESSGQEPPLRPWMVGAPAQG